MKTLKGDVKEVVMLDDLKSKEGEVVSLHGSIHRIRKMSDFSFVIIRLVRDELQCIYEGDSDNLKEEMAVLVTGKVVLANTSGGLELQGCEIKVLSEPKELLPITINKKEMNIAIDTKLDNRVVALRNPKEKAIFKIEEGVARGFREYLLKNNFTEIRTPKIIFGSAEGGANVFKLDYFGKEVCLAQSPQFYKQIMAGVYERVFEIAPVFRAEPHSTSRHLNEYISMDFEMSFIDSFYDVMEVEVGILKYTMELLKREYAKELEMLKVELPVVSEIPSISFKEAKSLLENELGRKSEDAMDLEPIEEEMLSKYAKDKYGSDFIFITHYPEKKRPFYVMVDPSDTDYTLSFDLLFRGVEITSGGQRIHEYDMQVERMKQKGVNPADFESFLNLHKYGMAPHGGIGLGLERLVAKILGISNVRETCLFPRDVNRVTP